MTMTKKVMLALAIALAAVWGRSAYAVPTPVATLDLTVTFSAAYSVKVNGIVNSTEPLVGYTAVNSTDSNQLGGSDYGAPSDSVTVTNDGAVTERWQLSVSTLAGNGNWTLNNATGSAHGSALNGATGHYGCTGSCPSAEQYGLQALFVSSTVINGVYSSVSSSHCPSPSDAAWDTVVTTVPALGSGLYNTYVGGANPQFANSTSYLGATGLPDKDNAALIGLPNAGDMLPLNNQTNGSGRRGLCVRVTMPSTTSSAGVSQTIRLSVTAIGG